MRVCFAGGKIVFSQVPAGATGPRIRRLPNGLANWLQVAAKKSLSVQFSFATSEQIWAAAENSVLFSPPVDSDLSPIAPPSPIPPFPRPIPPGVTFWFVSPFLKEHPDPARLHVTHAWSKNMGDSGKAKPSREKVRRHRERLRRVEKAETHGAQKA